MQATCRWYSVIPAALHKDDVFQAWRDWLRWMYQASSISSKTSPGSKRLRDIAAQCLWEDGDQKNTEESGTANGPNGKIEKDTKDDHKARLDHLKKAAGNSLRMSALLTHNYNFFNMRVVLLFGVHLWLEQAHKAQNKCTPEAQPHFGFLSHLLIN